jgi:hypothetical protein
MIVKMPFACGWPGGVLGDLGEPTAKKLPTSMTVTEIDFNLDLVGSARLTQAYQPDVESETPDPYTILTVVYKKPLPAGKAVPEDADIFESSWYWTGDGAYDGWEHGFRRKGVEADEA